jgi:hypothetical protein
VAVHRRSRLLLVHGPRLAVEPSSPPNKALQLTPRASSPRAVVQFGIELSGPALAVSALGAAERPVRWAAGVVEALRLWLDALLTPVVAAIGGWIAWRQHRTARDHYRFNLYEKRLRVYNSLVALLTSILREADVTPDGLREYHIASREAPFLFGPEIMTYLEDIRKKAIDLHTKTKRLGDQGLPVGPERNQLAEENGVLLLWLSNQIDDAVKIFEPYLNLNPS